MTDLFVAGLLLAALGYELYALKTHRKLITPVIRDWSKRWPLFPLLVGVLVGHLWW